MDDREMIIRVEQQMQDAAKNQLQIMADLKEIFHRIENDSKIVAQLKGDLNTYLETTTLKISENERRLSETNQLLRDLQNDLSKEKENREKSVEDVKKSYNDLKTELGNFTNDLKGSLRAIKWIGSVILGLATIVNLVISFYK